MGTHNPPMSSSLILFTSSSRLTAGSFHSWTISSAHACSKTPGSWGSSKSMSAELSILARALATRRPKAPFHCAVELIAISLNLPGRRLYGRFVTGERWVASNSADPGGVILRKRTSSTCCRGNSRIRSLRSSGVTGVCSACESVEGARERGAPGPAIEELIPVALECASVIVSRISLTERTTLSCTTARQEARSLRNAYIRHSGELVAAVLSAGSPLES